MSAKTWLSAKLMLIVMEEHVDIEGLPCQNLVDVTFQQKQPPQQNQQQPLKFITTCAYQAKNVMIGLAIVVKP